MVSELNEFIHGLGVNESEAGKWLWKKISSEGTWDEDFIDWRRKRNEIVRLAFENSSSVGSDFH